MLALALVAVTLVSASTEVAQEARPFTADAAAGVQAWASWDAEAGAYRLKLRDRGGAPRLAPVEPGIAPRHLDVGTDAAGRAVVTYARCAVEDTRCDLYVLDPATGVERRLRSSINTSVADEIAPSAHRGRIAFARVSRGRVGLFVSTLRGTSRPQRQPAPRRRRVLGIDTTELSSHGLFLVAQTPSDFRTERLYRIAGGRIRQLDRATSGGANAAHMTKPAVSGPFVYYARTNNGSGTGNRIYRIDLRGRRRSEALGDSRIQSASPIGGDRFLFAIGTFDTTEPGRLYESPRLRFTPARPGTRD